MVNAILPTAFTRMTDQIPDETFRSFMETRFTPARVAGFAAVLAHESCPVTGEAFLVGGGRVSRLLLGITEGMVFDEAEPEQLAEALDTIMNTDGAQFPPDRLAEFQSYLARLGFGGPDLSLSDLVKKGEES